MNFDRSPSSVRAAGDSEFRVELARENRILSGLAPVLRHLVASEDTVLLGDEPVARTRGMIESLVVELLRPLGDQAMPTHGHALLEALVDAPALLAHCHALAVEGQILDGLAERGIDPLLPPVIQTRVSAADPVIAGLAMSLMAAQTRFLRRQQRMELVPAELPGDLLHTCLGLAEDVVGAVAGSGARSALAAIRTGFDERKGRLAILAQLGLGLGDDFTAGLDPARAGFSLFATALSLITGLERETVVLSAAAGQQTRLALLLAMAGLEPEARETALLCLHPDTMPAAHWLTIDSHRAADLLGRGSPE